MGAEVRKAPLIGPSDERQAQLEAIRDRQYAVSNMIKVELLEYIVLGK
jgi:hypothetical protein